MMGPAQRFGRTTQTQIQHSPYESVYCNLSFQPISNMPKISVIFVLAEHQLCVVVTGTGIIFVVNNLWIRRT
jgi:hypothetical protein